mgnify:CR=1 FL=1
MSWNIVLKREKAPPNKKYIDKFIKDLRNNIKASMLPEWQQSGDSIELLEDIITHFLKGNAENLYHDYKYGRKKE